MAFNFKVLIGLSDDVVDCFLFLLVLGPCSEGYSNSSTMYRISLSLSWYMRLRPGDHMNVNSEDNEQLLCQILRKFENVKVTDKTNNFCKMT